MGALDVFDGSVRVSEVLKGLEGYPFPLSWPRIAVRFRVCVGTSGTIKTSLCSPLSVCHLQTKITREESEVCKKTDEMQIDVDRHTTVDIDR